MSSLRFLSKLLIFALALWAVYTSLSAFFGVTIYFPFRIVDEEAIPYHRWQTARIAVFLTFAYYAVMHLIAGSREMYPIQFLETYVKILTSPARSCSTGRAFRPANMPSSPSSRSAR